MSGTGTERQRGWLTAAIVALAAVLGILDASLGLHTAAEEQAIDADNVIDLADVVVGAAALWLARL